MSTVQDTTTRRPWTPARRFGLAGGAVYLVVALGGFAVTGFTVDDFAGMGHAKLLVFAVNPLHNCIHLAIALVWLLTVGSHRGARAANLGVGVVLGLVTVLGFVDGMGVLGMHGLADPDNFLHLATSTLALYFGSIGAERPGADEDDALLTAP